MYNLHPQNIFVYATKYYANGKTCSYLGKVEKQMIFDNELTCSIIIIQIKSNLPNFIINSLTRRMTKQLVNYLTSSVQFIFCYYLSKNKCHFFTCMIIIILITSQNI